LTKTGVIYVQPSAASDFLRSPTRYLFFTGKGGVGKTALAARGVTLEAPASVRVVTPLMRLRDPEYTKSLLVTMGGQRKPVGARASRRQRTSKGLGTCALTATPGADGVARACSAPVSVLTQHLRGCTPRRAARLPTPIALPHVLSRRLPRRALHGRHDVCFGAAGYSQKSPAWSRRQ